MTAFVANRGVEVLLKEGARVYADVLEGNAAQRTLRLAGDDVAFVRGTVIADGLKVVTFDDTTRTARSEGPGRFRAFKEPIVMRDGRAPRPTADGKPAMEARWSESLLYGESDASKSTLELRGGVNVRSKPSAERSDAVDANVLQLELVGQEEGPQVKGAKGATGASGNRDVQHVVAKGTARLESRTWLDAARSGDPRVFRVTGEHIEYDLRTREGLVVGDGTLLVNIPSRVDALSAKPIELPASGVALGADGTTRFRWAKRMELRHQFDDRFIVTMDDGVEVLHAGTRADDTLSLRAAVLEAVMDRPQVAQKAAATGDETPEQGVDLGGPAQLLSIKATGQVFVRTPQYDVECEEFDYSIDTGVARLRAREGRMVTILTKESPTPIRAESVVWDLRNGRLTVQRASGAAAR